MSNERIRGIILTLVVVTAGWMLTAWLIGRSLPAKPNASFAALRLQDRETGPDTPLRRSSDQDAPDTPAAPQMGGTAIAPPKSPEEIENVPTGPYSSWTNLKDAFEEAQRTGKPIMIEFYAEWSRPCVALKREVVQNSVHGRTVQMAVIPVLIEDRSRDPGGNPPEIENVKQHFGVEEFPTLVIFSPESGIGARNVGYTDADQTVAWVRKVAAMARAKTHVE